MRDEHGVSQVDLQLASLLHFAAQLSPLGRIIYDASSSMKARHRGRCGEGERRGPLAWCIIDRPESRNALTSRMYFGIRRAVDLVNKDPDLHALVITGVGDVFCPGGDLRREVQKADSASANVDVGELIGNDMLPFKTIRQSRWSARSTASARAAAW
jgi:hypothetical protein